LRHGGLARAFTKRSNGFCLLLNTRFAAEIFCFFRAFPFQGGSNYQFRTEIRTLFRCRPGKRGRDEEEGSDEQAGRSQT
jgi:hypothetical protein